MLIPIYLAGNPSCPFFTEAGAPPVVNDRFELDVDEFKLDRLVRPEMHRFLFMRGEHPAYVLIGKDVIDEACGQDVPAIGALFHVIQPPVRFRQNCKFVFVGWMRGVTCLPALPSVISTQGELS